MTDFIDGARKEIEHRLGQLRDEVKRLEAAAAALGGVGSGARRAGKRGPGRPRGGASAARRGGTSRRRGRPRGSGTRAAETLKIVTENPGITIPELASRMKIQPNYLYRVLPQLQKDGKVRKRGKGWHSAG